MEESISKHLGIIIFIVFILYILFLCFLDYLKNKKIREIISKNVDLNFLSYKGIEGDVTSIEIDVKDSGKGVIIKFGRKR